MVRNQGHPCEAASRYGLDQSNPRNVGHKPATFHKGKHGIQLEGQCCCQRGRIPRNAPENVLACVFVR